MADARIYAEEEDEEEKRLRVISEKMDPPHSVFV